MIPAPVPPDGEPDTAGIEAAKQAVYESMPVVLKDLVSRSEAEAAIGVPHGAGVPDRWLADVAVRAYLAAGRAAATPDPPKCADCERLRQQNHEAAARRDRENAQRDARLAEYENNVARGMKAVEHLRADWTTDPPSQEPGGFWRYASQNAREAIVAAYEAGKTDAAASPDERLREAGERLSNLVTLLGGYDGPGYLAAPNQGEHPDYYAAAKLFDKIMRDEKTGAAVVLAEWRVALAAADREAPDQGVWPDQSAVHGVLLEQVKDAYAEGITDTVAKLRARAAEVLPEVARFTLDEIEAICADREAPDEETKR